MLLNVLGDWKFKPGFRTDKNMVLTLHAMSGEEEMRAGIGEDKNHVQYIESMVVKIENPIQLKIGDEPARDMVAADLPTIGALKELYYDVIVEYAEKTRVTDDKIKN
jgi:hypothetical protein